MRLNVSALLLTVGILASHLPHAAADEPAPTATPVDVAATVDRSLPGQYHSHSLQANFVLQYMYITTPSGPVYFWGARIVGLDPFTPLNGLGLRVGDVITRLDGIRVGDNAFLDNHGKWQIPELDRHFAQTEIRYIITGTNIVRIGTIDLGNVQNSIQP